jgi:hypothetical protein
LVLRFSLFYGPCATNKEKLSVSLLRFSCAASVKLFTIVIGELANAVLVGFRPK